MDSYQARRGAHTVKGKINESQIKISLSPLVLYDDHMCPISSERLFNRSTKIIVNSECTSQCRALASEDGSEQV